MSKKIFSYLSVLYLFPHLFIYFFFKEKINSDIRRSEEHYIDFNLNGIIGFLYLMSFDIAFRAGYYYRIGKLGKVLSFLLPSYKSLMINSYCSIGDGLLLVHAYSTIINPNSIGENFRISHCCTIGESNGGKPTIKDNVIMHPGSIIFGNVTIGNNCIIGAGAVVSKTIPDNCVVVGNPAYIIRLNGVKTNQKL